MSEAPVMSPKKVKRNLIWRQLPAVEKSAPGHIDSKRQVRLLETAMSKTPRLFECTDISILGALMQCTELGLEPGDQGHVYLIPFRNNKTRQYECQIVISYKGMLQLMYRSRKILQVQPSLVYENDKFRLTYGSNGMLEHEPVQNGDKGDLVGAYVFVKLAGGGEVYEYMDIDEIEKRRKASRAGNSGPWKTHYEEMVQKTVIRHIAKYLPMSVKESAGVARDESVVEYDPEDDPEIRSQFEDGEVVDLDSDDFEWEEEGANDEG